MKPESRQSPSPLRQLAARLNSEYHNWCACRYGIYDGTGNEWMLFITPFLNSNNDRVTFFIRQLPNDEFELNDDGKTLADLQQDGSDFQQEHSSLVRYLERVYDVVINVKDELHTTCSRDELPDTINRFMASLLYMRGATL